MKDNKDETKTKQRKRILLIKLLLSFFADVVTILLISVFISLTENRRG